MTKQQTSVKYILNKLSEVLVSGFRQTNQAGSQRDRWTAEQTDRQIDNWIHRQTYRALLFTFIFKLNIYLIYRRGRKQY